MSNRNPILPHNPPPEPASGQSSFGARFEAAHRAFCLGFRRSKKGNLWRIVRIMDAPIPQRPNTSHQVNLTVFPDRIGDGFRYCVAGPFGWTTFSSSSYPTEEAALDALAAEFALLEVRDD